MDENINNIFEKFLSRDSVFKDKKVLQSSYTPDALLHRDEEINTLAKILAPALRKERPSNVFLYGKTGTGKTVTATYTTGEIIKHAEKKNIPLKVVYVNCKLNRIADTEYRVIAQLAREFNKEIPATGLPTDEVYKIFFNAIDEKEQIIIFILDEIDQLIKKVGDEIIYNLTRINTNLKKSQISLIGISNDLVFTDNLDPRVKSSLSEEEIIFPPYNALQLQEILRRRSTAAFKENVIQSGVLEKCAAYAAREHGDARRALELLRVAGEITERNGEQQLKIEHIDLAEEKIERDRVIDIVKTQPRQQQTTLYTIFSLYNDQKSIIYTGDVYDVYKSICGKVGLYPLTQRRVSDIIAELDMLGIINAKVVSKGRFGRTREISVAIPQSVKPKIMTILQQSLGLA
ncbi:MAG: ORC1-type DNA replication protein [Candidatus Woesearchaeota archaeon]|jgi:cell division control protein 6